MAFFINSNSSISSIPSASYVLEQFKYLKYSGGPRPNCSRSLAPADFVI